MINRRRVMGNIGNIMPMFGVPPITTNKRKLLSLKAFGGTEQSGTPTPDTPIDIVCNNGVLKARHQSGLPLGYTLLDYIESTGTQYIDTSLTIINGDISVQAVYEPTSFPIAGYNVIFGANSFFQAGYDFKGRANIGNAYTEDIFFALNTKVIIDAVSLSITSGMYFVNGADTGLSRPLGYDKEIWLFAANDINGAKYHACGKMYKFVAIRDNTIIMNLIPAKNSSDIIGMYDLVSGQFFTNQGTGDFIAGSQVSDPVEIYTDGIQETIEVDTTGGTAIAEMLLKVGQYKDEQSVLDGVVIRNVGIKVLDGTEAWQYRSDYVVFQLNILNKLSGSGIIPISTHFVSATSTGTSNVPDNGIGASSNLDTKSVWIKMTSITSVNDFKAFLADQYNAGTPVIVVYPLATPTTEQVAGQTLTLTRGTNIIDITQASLDNLELEVKAK